MKLLDFYIPLLASLKPYLFVLLFMAVFYSGYSVSQAVCERNQQRAWMKAYDRLEKTDHAIERNSPAGRDALFKRLYNNAP